MSLGNLKIPRTENRRERDAWRRGVGDKFNLDGLTPDRLIEYTTTGTLGSVLDLTKYIEETVDDIDITDNGDGTVKISIDNNFLPSSVFGETDEIDITDELDGNITVSINENLFKNYVLPTTDRIDIIDNLDGTIRVDISNNFEIEDIPTGFTDGSIPYASSGLLVEDNANLFHDEVTNNTGFGVNDPAYCIDVCRDFRVRTGTTGAFGSFPNDGFIVEESVTLGGVTTAPMLTGEIGGGAISKGAVLQTGLFILQRPGDLLIPNSPAIFMTDASATTATTGTIEHDPSTGNMDFIANSSLRLGRDQTGVRMSIGQGGSGLPSAVMQVEQNSADTVPMLQLKRSANDCAIEFKYGSSLVDNVHMGIDGSELNDPFVITSSTGDTILTTDYRMVMARDEALFAFGKPTSAVPGATIEIDIPLSTNIGLLVKQAASQSVPALEIVDNSDNVVLDIFPNGHIDNLDGISTESTEYGTGLYINNYGERAPLHTNGVGSYDHTGGTYEKLFTKTSGDDFTQADADAGNHILLRGANLGAMAEIKTYISATQVLVDGYGWDMDFASQSFHIINHPSLAIGDKNDIEISVDGDGVFEIHSYDYTGEFVAEIELDAGKNTTRGLLVKAKANGYSVISAQRVQYESGDLSPGEVGVGMLVLLDDTEATSSDSSTLIAAIAAQTTDVNDATKTGFAVLPGFSKALHVQGAEAEDPDYGYETTSGTSVDRVNGVAPDGTAFLESSASDLTIFDNNGDDILIGMSSTFEVIEMILATVSSKDLNFDFWYSKTGGNWTALTVLGDGTNGGQQSGIITFNAPADWTQDDEDIDGNAITNAYYIAITRTKIGAVPTLPVEDYFKTFADLETGMEIDGKGFIKPRHSVDSIAPNDSVYYSTTQSKLVYKDSSGAVNNLY